MRHTTQTEDTHISSPHDSHIVIRSEVQLHRQSIHSAPLLSHPITNTHSSTGTLGISDSSGNCQIGTNYTCAKVQAELGCHTLHCYNQAEKQDCCVFIFIHWFYILTARLNLQLQLDSFSSARHKHHHVHS